MEMNIGDYMKIIYILRHHMAKTHNGELTGEEMYPMLQKISPEKLSDSIYKWTKVDSADGIKYVAETNRQYYYTVKNFTIYQGRYDQPVDAKSEVYMDHTLFFKVENKSGSETQFRGAFIKFCSHVLNYHPGYTHLSDVDTAIKHIESVCDDDAIQELSPVLFAAKLLKLKDSNVSK